MELKKNTEQQLIHRAHEAIIPSLHLTLVWIQTLNIQNITQWQPYGSREIEEPANANG